MMSPPLIDAGVLELNPNPEHYFAEIEQASFSPSNVVPGPLRINGGVDYYNHRNGNDDYHQLGNLFRLMNPKQRLQLFENVAGAMQGVPRFIIDRQLEHFRRANPTYGAGVAEAIRHIHTARPRHRPRR
jgi:catalase